MDEEEVQPIPMSSGQNLAETESPAVPRRRGKGSRSSAGSSGPQPAAVPGPANQELNMNSLLAQLSTLSAKQASHDEAFASVKDQLKRIADNFEQLASPAADDYDSGEDLDEGDLLTQFAEANRAIPMPEHDPVELMLSGLDKTGDAPVSEEVEEAALVELRELLDSTQKPPEYGPEISENVAQSFSLIAAHNLPSDAMDKMKQEYKVPANAKNLSAPRLNPCVYKGLDAQVRTADVRRRLPQQFISTALIAQARLAEALWKLAASQKLTADEVKPLLSNLMDSARCIGQAQRELSFRRRNELKSAIPALAPLCSADVPVTEFLFGDKLEEDLKAAQAAAKLVVKPSFVGRASNRYQPYTKPRGGSLNGRGGLRRGQSGSQASGQFRRRFQPQQQQQRRAQFK